MDFLFPMIFFFKECIYLLERKQVREKERAQMQGGVEGEGEADSPLVGSPT